MTFEVCWWEVGFIEDSNDDLDRFSNVVLVHSNLYEIRYVKLVSWKEDFEGRLYFSGFISMEVLNEEEFDVSKHAGECEDEEW